MRSLEGGSAVTVEQQLRALCAMAVAGFTLGALFDGMTLLRRALSAGRLLTGLMDLLFGVCCALGIVLTALVLRIDPYRLYVFAGLALGMGAYAATIGTLVRILQKRTQKIVGKR